MFLILAAFWTLEIVCTRYNFSVALSVPHWLEMACGRVEIVSESRFRVVVLVFIFVYMLFEPFEETKTKMCCGFGGSAEGSLIIRNRKMLFCRCALTKECDTC